MDYLVIQIVITKILCYITKQTETMLPMPSHTLVHAFQVAAEFK